MWCNRNASAFDSLFFLLEADRRDATTKLGKVVAFGKLHDESFWTDLKKLQALQNQYSKLGVFAQVIDSKDSDAIRDAAKKHGVTFPVVVAIKSDWDKAYKVSGVSRTIY